MPLTRENSGAKGTRTPNPLLAKQRQRVRRCPLMSDFPCRQGFWTLADSGDQTLMVVKKVVKRIAELSESKI